MSRTSGIFSILDTGYWMLEARPRILDPESYEYPDRTIDTIGVNTDPATDNNGLIADGFNQAIIYLFRFPF